MAKCKVCGTRLAEGVAKCPSCGAAAGSTVSGTVSPGANLQKSVCPACNKQILGEHKYCPNCGTNLNSASARATNNIQQNPAIQQMTQTRTQANGQELVSDNSHKNKNETEKQQLQSNAQAKQQESVQDSGKYTALKVMQLMGYLLFAVGLDIQFGLDIPFIVYFILIFLFAGIIYGVNDGSKKFILYEFLLSVGAVAGMVIFLISIVNKL